MKQNGRLRNSSVCVALLLSVLFFMNSCRDKLEPIKIDPAFASYVISFTSGVVSNQTKVRVRLVQEVPEAVPGKELSFNPFSFSPDIKGKVTWVDKQTIEFAPENLLPSGEIYTVDFELDKFVKVPDSLSTLTFRFQVIKQDMEYEFNGISPYKEMDKQWQKIHGIFNTADYADPVSLEKCVEAEGDKKFKISWSHSADGRVHKFSIDSVERKAHAYSISLKWDGDPIGVDKEQTIGIEMPGLNDFKVIHYKAITNPTPSIDVFFSDPINKTQDLSGLFQLYPSTEVTTIVDGNVVHIIPISSASGAQQLVVMGSIKNVFDQPLGENYTIRFTFESIKPQVELIGDGVIIPNSKGILFPFKAVCLSAVDVKIIQVFENNMVQFLQVNQLDGDREIKRVGRIVYNQEVTLTADEPIDYKVWNTFALDLSKLIEPQPGAIYRVEISFRKKHSLYPCAATTEEDEYKAPQEEDTSYDQPNDSYWDYYEEEYYYEGEYNWEEREDPCKSSYYNSQRAVRRNILASDLGLIAKAGSNGEYFIAVTDLRTAEPLSGVDLEFRNYQNQVMATSSTNSDGLCRVKLTGKPFVLVAKDGKQRGYLRLDDASSLSLSMFDVSGEELKKGVKGFIYGERDVWRPGDMMYLTFILEDKNNALPDNHPVIMELYNPEGQLYKRVVKTANVNGFYSFATQTSPEAPTGSWNVKMQVGGSTFARKVRVETIKPNRMKINLSFPVKLIKKGVPTNGKLQVNWLHGAPAANAKAEVDATIVPAKTEFAGCKGYQFDDQTKSFTGSDISVFKGNLNADGKAVVPAKLEIAENTPGMVAVQFKTRAYDAGGDFSVDRFVLNYSPYTAYVGVKTPEGSGWNGAVYSDENTVVPIAFVDQSGKPLTGQVKIEVYNIYWRWWWDHSDEENMADFISNQNAKLVLDQTITVKNGRAMYNMRMSEKYYGRMLMRITDTKGGHSTSTVFYSTYKDYWSNAGSDKPGGAEMLIFSTDKKQYNVGEKVQVELPATHKGRALVSIETGSKVLENFWVDASEQSKFTFEVTPEMAPNIFIHVTFIQPHNHEKNDFPIRMYGVMPVTVYDPKTHITPVITMAKSLKPEQKFNVTVKEAKGQDMTYTIAIVDEGLLDITRFKTPNPWDAFYAQEALGVRTWDLYKYVAGAYTGKLAGLLAIGGDGFLNKKGKENNNRFKPVVLFKGPFFLKGGSVQTLQFTMPNYVGSVRVMVVAGNTKGAYGNAEKAVPVKQALMVLPTFPRVVSPTEVIKVPVTVFAMEKTVKNVTVSLAPDRNFQVLDGATRQITFSKPGDQVVEFQVRVKNVIANGKIVVRATSGNIKSTAETNLKIRMPNPPETKNISAVILPGQTWTQTVNAVGLPGTNSGTLEVTNMYPIDLGKRLNYLIQYPHGCIEQTTSSAFPQLFLQYVMDLPADRKAKIETNVKATLERIKSFQVSSGGFTYWPGEGGDADEWGSNYAGHFMLEAQAKGYQLPVGMFDSWVSYQTRLANAWTPNLYQYNTDLIQAYRLYTLALAKKPASSAMNRMRESALLTASAKWRLAAAYAVAGKPDIASGIIASIQPDKEAIAYRYSYGSDERDDAMRLETLVLLRRNAQAKALVADLAKSLASNEWMSTQSTAYVLMAVSKYVGSSSMKQLSCSMEVDGQIIPLNGNKSISQTVLDFSRALRKQISVKNTSNQNIYLTVSLTGVPLMSSRETGSENLGMVVRYCDMKGNAINPLSLKQGTDFYAEVQISHPGTRTDYDNLALQQMFPSGWEIINTRMDVLENTTIASADVPRYQDIRDDRVFMYFDINKAQKKTFRVLLHAAYLGKFYMPSVYCEAMYDNTIQASTKGQWVEVVR